MKVENITLSQYIALKNKTQVNYNLRYGVFTGEDKLNIGPIIKKPLGVVKNVQQAFNDIEGVSFQTYVELLEENFNIDLRTIGSRSIYDLHISRLYLRDQISIINKLEGANLGHTPSSEEQAAGLERFDVFGNYPQFRVLAGGGDYDKIEEVKLWPYEFCFMELKYKKEEREFEKDLNKILNKKIK